MTTTRPSTTVPAPGRRDLPALAELRCVSKTYGKGGTAVAAVHDLDLAVRSGELLAVLGPNGAGKSTAISLLTGLTAPTSGAALLFGQDPAASPRGNGSG